MLSIWSSYKDLSFGKELNIIYNEPGPVKRMLNPFPNDNFFGLFQTEGFSRR